MKRTRNENNTRNNKNVKNHTVRKFAAGFILGLMLSLGITAGLGENNSDDAVLGVENTRDDSISTAPVDVLKTVAGDTQVVTRTNTVTNTVEVPTEKVVTNTVEVPVEVPVEKVVTRTVEVPVEKTVVEEHKYVLTAQKDLGNGQWECTLTCEKCGDSYTVIVGEAAEIQPTPEPQPTPDPEPETPVVEDPVDPEPEVVDPTPVDPTPVDPTPVDPEPQPEPEAHTHSYSLVDHKDASCSSDGYNTYACECGDTYTEVIPATGHNYVEDPSTAVEATEDHAGKTADKICENCGDTISGEEIPAIEHVSHRSETECSFNEYGWGFYNNISGEEICTTTGAYVQYLTDNYPGCEIHEEGNLIWAD